MAQQILEQCYDEDYKPTEEEVLEYARYIGIEPEKEADLLWIAREGINLPLPDDWKPCQREDGEVYYFNFATGESIWDHPADAVYRQKVVEAREGKGKKQSKKNAKSSKTVSVPDTACKKITEADRKIEQPPPSYKECTSFPRKSNYGAVTKIQNSSPAWFKEAFSFITSELITIKRENRSAEAEKCEMKADIKKLKSTITDLERQKNEQDKQMCMLEEKVKRLEESPRKDATSSTKTGDTATEKGKAVV